jgi:NTP pyrophosphatase (non-canonical NTP hydrolase)
VSDALHGLRESLREFARARDWEQFHTPKNLAMALSVEAAELMEIFQWLRAEESASLPPEARDAAAEEIADVLLYLVRLADVLEIDPVDAARRKLALNEARYPADKSRGHARKYTDLE